MSHHGRVVSVILEFEDKHVERMSPAQAEKHIGSDVGPVTIPTRAVPAAGGIQPSPSHPFYTVFFDDDDRIVHTTSAHRTWSEARDAALDWADKYGAKARQFEIVRWYKNEPAIIAPQRGSVRVRARTKWYISEDEA